jgi:nitrite reductase/ring-hydroxylating ferredoxin subunit/uncharacterized membrane protein
VEGKAVKQLGLIKEVDRLEDAHWLDPLADAVRSAVVSVVRSPAVRDVLHGVPLGHPLHPTAVQVPIGAWLSAGLLDATGRAPEASRFLVGLGAVSALPAAVAGATDLSQLRPEQARIGVVHASANVVALALYTASYLQRRRDRHVSGRVLGFLGLAVVSASGFLGGHLSFRKAAGANHAEGVPSRFPKGWQSIGPLTALPENELTGLHVGDQPLVALRRGSTVDVLSNVCAHLSGPLSEGELIGRDTDDPCVKCPWHGSVFSMRTGEVVHGPATAAVPALRSRIVDGAVPGGAVEVLMPGAG